MALGQTQSVVSDSKGIEALMADMAAKFRDSVESQFGQAAQQPSSQASQAQATPPAQDASASTQGSHMANNQPATMQDFIQKMMQLNQQYG